MWNAELQKPSRWKVPRKNPQGYLLCIQVLHRKDFIKKWMNGVRTKSGLSTADFRTGGKITCSHTAPGWTAGSAHPLPHPRWHILYFCCLLLQRHDPDLSVCLEPAYSIFCQFLLFQGSELTEIICFLNYCETFITLLQRLMEPIKSISVQYLTHRNQLRQLLRQEPTDLGEGRGEPWQHS